MPRYVGFSSCTFLVWNDHFVDGLTRSQINNYPQNRWEKTSLKSRDSPSLISESFEIKNSSPRILLANLIWTYNNNGDYYEYAQKKISKNFQFIGATNNFGVRMSASTYLPCRADFILILYYTKRRKIMFLKPEIVDTSEQQIEAVYCSSCSIQFLLWPLGYNFELYWFAIKLQRIYLITKPSQRVKNTSTYKLLQLSTF